MWIPKFMSRSVYLEWPPGANPAPSTSRDATAADDGSASEAGGRACYRLATASILKRRGRSAMSTTARSVGFIGLGQMGFGMAGNLLKAGHDVLAYDVAAEPLASPRAAVGPRAIRSRSAPSV